MDEARWLARYGAASLAIIAGAEWILGRTVSRLAAAPMLEGVGRAVIEGFGWVGYRLVSPALLLALSVTMLVALLIGSEALSFENSKFKVQSSKFKNAHPSSIVHRPSSVLKFTFACFLALFAVVAAAHTLFEAQLWLNISFNLMSAIGVWWIAILALQRSNVQTFKRSNAPAILLVALAYTGWYVYVLAQLLGIGDDLSIFAIRLGELAAALTPMAFFFAIAGKSNRWRNLRRWTVPIIVALLFAAGNIADAVFNQGFTGVITTWSLGLNLVWPWPLYAVSLALFIYSVITAFSSHESDETYANPNTGVGLLLLLFAGYNLQIPYEHLLAILSLTLLTGLFKPFSWQLSAISYQLSVEAEADSR